MAALDDVDGVDLQVAQVRHRCRGGLGAGAEGLGGVQALGMQPDSPALDGGELDEGILQKRTLATKRIFSVVTLPQLPLNSIAALECSVRILATTVLRSTQCVGENLQQSSRSFTKRTRMDSDAGWLASSTQLVQGDVLALSCSRYKWSAAGFHSRRTSSWHYISSSTVVPTVMRVP
jgi:hypothetical protein